MPETLNIQFTPTVQDYIRANRALAFKNPRRWVVLGALLLTGLYLIFSMVNNTTVYSPFLWAITALILFYAVVLLVVTPLRISRNVKGNDRLLAELTWELSDAQVVMKNRYTETKYDWGSFQSLTENREYFFLRQTATKQFYNFIPKRALASPERQQQFRELIYRHIAPSKNAKA